MNRHASYLMGLLAAFVLAAPGSAQYDTAVMPPMNVIPGDGQQSILAVRRQLRAAKAEVGDLQDRLRLNVRELQEARQRADAGRLNSADLLPLELEVHRAESALVARQHDLLEVQRLAALADPVDILLKSASIRQAAEALSRVSSAKITVDAKAAEGKSIQAEATNVPLGAVLEVIANAADLTIAPDDGGGITLRTRSGLTVNGKTINTEAANWPWSDEWAAFAGGYNYPVGRRWLRLFEAVPCITAIQPPNSASVAPRRQTGSGK